MAGNEQRVTSSEQRVTSDGRAAESQSRRDAVIRRVGASVRCDNLTKATTESPSHRDERISVRRALRRPPNRMFMPHSTLAGLASTPHQIKP